MTKQTLTLDRLRELLSYDPDTGLFHWRLARGNGVRAGQVAGAPHSEGYWRIRIDGTEYLSHRLAVFHVTGSWPPIRVERRRPRHNTSGFKGVTHHRGKWRAVITVNDVHVHLGYFTTAEEAHAFYNFAALAHYGKYARVGSMAQGNAWQSAKTHCPVGHEYTAANTKLIKSTKPGCFKRQCRRCKADLEHHARRRGKLMELARRSGDPAAPFPVVDGATGSAVVAVLREAFGERSAVTPTCDRVMQAFEVIEHREKAEREARKERSRAAREERRQKRNQARRKRLPVTVDHTSAPATAIEAPAILTDEEVIEAAILAMIGDMAPPPALDHTVDPAVDQAAALDQAQRDRAQDVHQARDQAVEQAPPAPTAAPPCRPRPFERLAIRFIEWREAKETRERYADDRLLAELR